MQNQKHSIDGLKRLVISSKDLSEVMSYFLALSEKNLLEGKPLQKLNEELTMAVKCSIETINKKLSKNINLLQSILISLQAQNFFHGVCIVDGGIPPLSFFYFSNIKMGMIALEKLGENSELFRFSLTLAPSPEMLH